MNRRTLLRAAATAPAFGLLGTSASTAPAEAVESTLDPLMAAIAAHPDLPISIHVLEYPCGRFTIREQLDYLRRNDIRPNRFVKEHRYGKSVLAYLSRDSGGCTGSMCIQFNNDDVTLMVWDCNLPSVGQWMIVDEDFPYEVLDI